jgi:hypothetical protein
MAASPSDDVYNCLQTLKYEKGKTFEAFIKQKW